MDGEALVVVVPAAGVSRRYREAADRTGRAVGGSKLAEVVHGRTVLAWSVGAFLRREDVAEVVVPTTDPGWAAGLLGGLVGDGRVVLTGGGANRAASVLAGLRAARTSVSVAPWVAVHDAARPALSGALIEAVWRAAREAQGVAGAAGPAMPVGLTVRRAEAALPALAGATLPREGLYVMQTPQVARRELLRAALERCPVPLEQVTDDLQALELAGVRAMLVPGESVNVKVTVPEDLDFLARNWTPEWH